MIFEIEDKMLGMVSTLMRMVGSGLGSFCLNDPSDHSMWEMGLWVFERVVANNFEMRFRLLVCLMILQRPNLDFCFTGRTLLPGLAEKPDC